MNKKASNLTSSNLESFAKKTIVKYNPLSSHFSMSLPENSFSMCDSTSLVVQLSAHLFGARTFSCLFKKTIGQRELAGLILLLHLEGIVRRLHFGI